VIDILEKSSNLRKKLMENTQFFRKEMKVLGFTIPESIHPIAPVMLGDAQLAKNFSDELLKEGIYVIGFSYPVVPKGKARIRTQISAAHEMGDLKKAIFAFEKIGKKLKVIK
jgi:glycine C-acetyltransferase